jgi:hypothetical protein
VLIKVLPLAWSKFDHGPVGATRQTHVLALEASAVEDQWATSRSGLSQDARRPRSTHLDESNIIGQSIEIPLPLRPSLYG